LKRKQLIHENEVFRNVYASGDMANPLQYYQFFKKRTELLKQRKLEGFDIDDSIIVLVRKERKKGLMVYLKTMPFLKRKRNLARLFLDREEGISFLDILTC
jgi:hypothetical protein